MSLTRNYQEAFSQRSGVLAVDATATPVDWADAPLKFTLRPRHPEIVLPSDAHVHAGEPATVVPETLTLAHIARICWWSTGLQRGRLEVDWNRPASQVLKAAPTFTRGAASGGGLYPLDLYIVADRVAGLADGAYQYCEARSSLLPIRLTGTALGSRPSPGPGGQVHVILAARFWRNVFKYRSLGYQVVSEDVGAMLGALQHAAEALKFQTLTRYLFEDSELERLLGLEAPGEGAMAVLQIGPVVSGTPLPNFFGSAHPVALRHSSYERSRRIEVPVDVLELHAATRQLLPPAATAFEVKPEEQTATAAISWPLPVADLALRPLRPGMRRSSMGRQRSRQPCTQQAMSTLLRQALVPYRNDLREGASSPHAVRLAVVANHVVDLPPGAYDYEWTDHALRGVSSGPEFQRELQSLYYLDNYNLQQMSFMVVAVARQQLLQAALGDRSIRVCNAEAGLVAQRLYEGAAALDLACGAVLGFNCRKVNDLIGVDAHDECAVLCILIAGTRETPAAFNFDLW